MSINSKLSDKTRNELCPCGSELKQKHCHGDPKKLQMCNKIAQFYMMKLIMEERKKRGLEPYAFTCEKCGKGTDQPRPSEISEHVLLCPDEDCGGTVKQNEKPKPEDKPEPEKKSSIILEA
jgi:hypothetical protein